MREDKPGTLPTMAQEPDRRSFLTNGLMIAGLTVSYGLAGAFGLRYLIPTDRSYQQRLLVGLKPQMPPGSATPFTTPEGQTINVIHGPRGFLALSDVCPHLGCKVHWESAKGEFLCPCHDGHFDAEGNPVSGPPADMGAALAQFDVVEDGDLVYLDLRVAK